MKEKIAIIGYGNMGQAITQGLLRQKITDRKNLVITNTKTQNNKLAVRKADIVIFAVKPQILSNVLEEVKGEISANQLIISIAAGCSLASIEKIIGSDKSIVRVMPNLAAKVGKSMSVWVKNQLVTESQTVLVKELLSAIGNELELDKEEKIDLATAISGSGPAYFFYVTELLEKAAIEIGLSKTEAQKLSRETLIGSAKLMEQSPDLSARDLRSTVTSKGGTTEAALTVFIQNNLYKFLLEGVKSAVARAKQLSKG